MSRAQPRLMLRVALPVELEKEDALDAVDALWIALESADITAAKIGSRRRWKYSSEVCSQFVSQWLLSEKTRTRAASAGMPRRPRKSA